MYKNIVMAANGRRNRPVADEYFATLEKILKLTGEDIGAVITSGGQDPVIDPKTGRKNKNPRRIGTTTRHDTDHTGHAHTTDLVLTRGGKQRTPGQDPALYEAFIRNAASKFPGIGHYSWGIHVGTGSEAFWGPNKRGNTADPRFRAAFEEGRQGATAPYDPRRSLPANPAVSMLQELGNSMAELGGNNLPHGARNAERADLINEFQQHGTMGGEQVGEEEQQGSADGESSVAGDSQPQDFGLDSAHGGPMGQGLAGLATLFGKAISAGRKNRPRLRHDTSPSPFASQILASIN